MSDFTVFCEDCGKKMEIEGENLPELASDTEEFECESCGAINLVGWYAEVDVRGIKKAE